MVHKLLASTYALTRIHTHVPVHTNTHDTHPYSDPPKPSLEETIWKSIWCFIHASGKPMVWGNLKRLYDNINHMISQRSSQLRMAFRTQVRQATVTICSIGPKHNLHKSSRLLSSAAHSSTSFYPLVVDSWGFWLLAYVLQYPDLLLLQLRANAIVGV